MIQYIGWSILHPTVFGNRSGSQVRVSRGRVHVTLPQEKVTLEQIIVFSLVFLPGFLPLFSPFARLFIQIR